MEFGGSFNDVTFAEEMYDQMKQEIQIPKERDCDFEGNLGDLCLVEEDRTWHRARILSKYQNKYNIFLIDDGRTFWVTSTVLARGQKSFFNLPPMMELFIIVSASPLSSGNRWSPTASEFLKCLRGISVFGCVQDVMMPNRIILLDIPGKFKEMQELGFARFMPLENFKQLVGVYLLSPQDIVSLQKSYTQMSDVPTRYEDIQSQYFYPQLQTGVIETVEVMQVVHPLKIFCKLHVFSYELKKLSEQIHKFYEGTDSTVMGRLLCDGSPCAAKGSDGKWYRSLLKHNIVSDNVKVFHVDYGMADFVKVGNIRPLSSNFYRLPVVTYHCSLYGIMDDGSGWTTSQIENLKIILQNQIFLGKIEQQSSTDGIYCVTLFGNDSVNINSNYAVEEKCLYVTGDAVHHCPVGIQKQESFKSCHKHAFAITTHLLDSPSHHEKVMSAGPAKKETSKKQECPKEILHGFQPEQSPHHSKGDFVIPEHLFTIGSVLDVNVLYMEKDQILWCQLADHMASLRNLMHDIQSHYSCSPFQSPTGSVCIIKHPDNGLWYRAQITTYHLTSHVYVHLLDYGQMIKVPMQDLRPIDPKFLTLKCQAFQCSLFNKTSSGNLTFIKDVMADILRPLDQAPFCNILLKCTVCAVMYDSQGKTLNLVNIISPCPRTSNSDHLFPNEFDNDIPTTLTHILNVGAKETVRITCVKGVKCFFGQLKQNDPIIEKLTKDIQRFCSLAQATIQQFLPQMMCLARYGEKWHRGQIKSINSKIIVHFVDYGDVLALDTSDVLPVPAQLSKAMSIPFQAVRFQLFNVNLEESHALNDWFRSHVTDSTFTATILERSSDGKLSVQLHDGKTNINLMMKEKWNESKIRKNASITLPKESFIGKGHFGGEMQAYLNRNELKQSGKIQTVIENIECSTKNLYQSELSTGKTTTRNVGNSQYLVSYSKLIDLPSRSLTAELVSEVYISYCNNPSSFFIQLASEECDIVAMVDKLNMSDTCKIPIDFSQLHPGDLVNVEYPTDGALFRAVVKNKNEDGTIQVEFIDFGNEVTLPVLKVWHLESEFLQFPRYSIHCCLSTGDRKIQTQWTKEKMTACESKLVCYFIKDNSSFWEVNLYQDTISAEPLIYKETTENIICNTPQTLFSQAACSGQYKKPELFLGQTIEVYASSIVGPDYFWCQYTDSTKLDAISLEVQDIGNHTQTVLISMDNLSPGDPCLALYPDDSMWYRAQLISKSASSVFVLFVDYGNENEISHTSVRAVPTKQLETPPQAFLCHLEGFKLGYWNDSAAARFYELIVDKPMKVKIQNMEDNINYSSLSKYYVDVECKMLLINDIMKDYWNNLPPTNNLPSMLNPQEPLDATKSFLEDTHSLPCELQQEASLANGETDSKGSVNFTSQSEMKKLLQTNSPNLKKISNTEDGSHGSLQYLPKVTDLPHKNINQNFTSEVYISHVNSVSSFFVQLAKDENTLHLLTEQLNSGGSLLNNLDHLNSVKCGSLVKAVFPDDESWYRAVIKDNNGNDEILVEFIDFGNVATLNYSNVCRLDEQFLHFPRFSIHCCLEENIVGIQNKIKGEHLIGNVLTIGCEKKLFCKFIKEANCTWEVKISDQKIFVDELSPEELDDFNELQTAPSHEEFSSSQVVTMTNMFLFKKPKILIEQVVEVYASLIVGPDYFWCQYANSEKLDEISVIAQEIGNDAETNCIKINQLCPGRPCIALFSDEMWYRAQIIKSSTVIFVDYGNEAETEPDSIKPLPARLIDYPLQAFPCQLEGFNPSEGYWTDDANAKFCELISDKFLKVTIRIITNDFESLTSPYHVRVHSNDYDLNNQMKSYWNLSEKPLGPNFNTVPLHEVSSNEKELCEISNEIFAEKGAHEHSSVSASDLGPEERLVVIGNGHLNEEPANCKFYCG